MTLPSIEDILKTSKQLVEICENQIFALNLTKSQPGNLYKNLLQNSCATFSKMKDFIPVLKGHCTSWKQSSLTPQQIQALHETEYHLEKLERLQAEIMFLMDHFKEYAEEGDFEEDLLTFFNKDKDSTPSEEIQDLIKQVADVGLSLKKKIEEPSSEHEELIGNLMDKFQETIQRLIMEGIHPQVLEATLFTQWLHMASLDREESEEYFARQVQNAPTLMLKVIEKLNELSSSLKDTGPTEDLKRLGENLDVLRDVYKELKQEPLSDKENKAQSAKALDAFVAILDEFATVPIRNLEACFLYYWIRFSIIESSVPEEYFQKLERNWPEVFEEVSKYASGLMELSPHI